MIGIYKITSPSKKIYIGQSVDIKKRWRYYLNLNCKYQQKLLNSFIKYGVDKHKFEIVQLCEREQLNELEKYYVDLFQTFNNKFGLNLKDGGGSKGKMSEESRQKLREANLGKKQSPESTRKTVLGNTGQKRSEEIKRKMSIANKGRVVSKETLERMRLANVKLILNTETGIFYFGSMEASDSCCMNDSTLRSKLNGRKTNKTNFIYV